MRRVLAWSVCLLGGAVATVLTAQAAVPVDENGIVVPRRPVVEAIADAMEFLKKADGAYVPGNIDGELAGYFASADRKSVV